MCNGWLYRRVIRDRADAERPRATHGLGTWVGDGARV